MRIAQEIAAAFDKKVAAEAYALSDVLAKKATTGAANIKLLEEGLDKGGSVSAVGNRNTASGSRPVPGGAPPKKKMFNFRTMDDSVGLIAPAEVPY